MTFTGRLASVQVVDCNFTDGGVEIKADPGFPTQELLFRRSNFSGPIRKTTLNVENVDYVSLDRCEFRNLGIITTTTSVISFVNSTVEATKNSIINTSLPQEGAILAVSHSNITFINLTVANSTGDNMKYGYIQFIIELQDKSRLNMSYCEFLNNNIEEAGILFSEYSEVHVDSTKFFANSASFFISLFHSNGTISNSEFTSNIACSSFEYCVSVNNGNLSVSNTAFRNNGNGGNSRILGCVFGSLQVENVTFSENQGGTLSLSGCSVQVETSVFINNTSTDDSSIIYVQKTNLNMISSNLSYNTPTLHGPKVPCCCRLHTHRCRASRTYPKCVTISSACQS